MMRQTAALLLLMLAAAGCAQARMSQSAYVWQRAWTPAVEQAVRSHAGAVDGLTVLCAEIMRDQAGKPAGINVRPNWELLQRTGVPVSLAIRVGSYPGPFGADQAMTQYLLGEVRKALHAARAAGLEPAGLEIDFDCATRKLAGYAEWLRLIRPQLGGVPLSITTLPTWMSQPQAFAELVAATDHFVLQVHSVQRAETFDSDAVLCDPQLAQKWTEQAAGFGKAFRVALPTYAYRLAYDTAGQLVEVAAEDASPLQHPDWRYRVIRAEPEPMSALIRGWQAERPKHCRGVIWYRLPIGAERYNWDSLTWLSVMAGGTGGDAWQASMQAGPDGAVEIELVQRSAIAVAPPRRVRVAWGDGTALAWDGQRHYSVNAAPERALVWQWPAAMPPPLLPQGTRWTIGWLRLESATDLSISILNDDD